MAATVDVVVVGGGHNGLVAAAYLARAGRSVRLLERLDVVGGAAVSSRAFAGLDARLSRYSYLVSLLPARIRTELGVDVELRRRRYSSYTPAPGTDRGLLVDTRDPAATRASFAAVGARDDAGAWAPWQQDLSAVATAFWPTLTEPLRSRSVMRQRLAPRLWEQFIERPIGAVIRDRFSHDVVRGVVATDALIGTFASLDAPSLAQNRCFLYHVIGGGTGDWDVPVGGMGAVTAALDRAARDAGAQIVTGAEVTAIDPDGHVRYRTADAEHEVAGGTVVSNVAPAVLATLLGRDATPPEGAQIKVNMLLRRLPRLLDAAVSPEAAFGGTFHVNETATQLEGAYAAALSGRMPDPLPLETYCHSLTDPSILGPELRAAGVQTLTAFALHAPHRLGLDREHAQRAVVASLDSVLAEPLADVLLTDADGRACIEVRTTADLEADLRMPGGNIFHGELDWPFAEDDAPLGTPAERWGVATADARILLCGSGSRRGGAVSGLGGYAAAMALLER